MQQAPSRPPVSVLMTTHNGAPLLAASLESILAQGFRDFELVVVDDASTDGATPALLAGYAARDPRIRLLHPGRNLGVVGARNFGFAACRGACVAMLDHDDLSHPDRLGAQVAHLAAHPRCVLVGSEVRLLGEPGQGTAGRITDHRDTGGSALLLRWMLHVDNPLTWSSVMLRAAAVRRLGTFLRAEFEYADDFDLYHRLLGIGEMARLEAVLTSYRWHARNTSHREGEVLAGRAVQVLAQAYRAWLEPAAAAEAAGLVVRHLSERRPAPDAATLDRLGHWLEQLLAGFTAQHAETKEEEALLARYTAGVWWRAVRAAVRAGRPGAIGQYRARPGLQAIPGEGPATGELLGSALVGALRAYGPARRLLARLRA